MTPNKMGMETETTPNIRFT